MQLLYLSVKVNNTKRSYDVSVILFQSYRDIGKLECNRISTAKDIRVSRVPKFYFYTFGNGRKESYTSQKILDNVTNVASFQHRFCI
jgi:hypothetical protein